MKEQIPSFGYFSTINIFAALSYIAYFSANSFQIDDSLLFGSPDSREYFRAGIDLWNGTFGEAAARRPLLYPIFLLITHGAGGSKAIWIAQIIAWLISANLIASAAYVITKKKTYYLLAGFGFLINFSIMSMTMQALTEVITILLLSLMIFYIARNFQTRRNPRFIITIVFLLSLLTVLRPVFIHILALSLITVLFFYHKAFMKKPTTILILFLSLMPVIAQISVMKQNYNILGISRISDDTLRFYLVTRAMHDEFHPVYDSAAYQETMKVAATLSKTEILNHMFDNPLLYASQIQNNIFDNIRASSPFLPQNGQLVRFMRHLNNAYFLAHFAALITLIVFAIRLQKQFVSKLLLAMIFLIPGWYIILTSGISFWQGDRLILPAWPLCLIAYLILMQELLILKKESKLSVAK